MPSIPRMIPTGGRGERVPVTPPVPTARSIVDCAVYIDGVRQDCPVDFRAALQQVEAAGRGFVWLGLHAPDERQMNEVGDAFGLHHLMIEDAVHAHQRPKLELYDETLLLVLRTIGYVEHDSVAVANDIVQSGEIMVLAGRNFVITVRHGDHNHLSDVRHRLEEQHALLALGPAAVMHAVADRVVDSYLAVASEMQSDVDELEEGVFATDGRRVDIDVVYMFKREVLEFRRAVVPLGQPLARLSGAKTLTDVTPVAFEEANLSTDAKEIRRHFRDVADHLTTASELIVEFDERLTALLNAAATKVGIQQNSDMRKISSWAAIAAVPTAIAGIYGMNFEHMPELAWVGSYPAVLLTILIACILLWRTFRRNHWL